MSRFFAKTSSESLGGGKFRYDNDPRYGDTSQISNISRAVYFESAINRIFENIINSHARERHEYKLKWRI